MLAFDCWKWMPTDSNPSRLRTPLHASAHIRIHHYGLHSQGSSPSLIDLDAYCWKWQSAQLALQKLVCIVSDQSGREMGSGSIRSSTTMRRGMHRILQIVLLMIMWGRGWKGTEAAVVDKPVLQGVGVLGCGYDVLNGFYADSQSCRQSLLEFAEENWEEVTTVNGNVYKKPKPVYYLSSVRTTISIASGRTIREYAHSVSSRLGLEGSYLFFSSSLNAYTSSSSAQSSDSAFTNVQYNVGLYQLRLPADASAYLTPTARADIDGMADLTAFYDLYGTHFVNSILVGGRASFSSTTTVTKFTSMSSSDIAVAAKMAAEATISALAKQEQSEQVKAFKDASTIEAVALGGNPQFANLLDHGADWAGSVVSFPEFANFLDDRSLAGIWTLASTPERETQLHDFYPEYCKAREMKVVEYSTPLRGRIVPLTITQNTDRGSGANDNIRACIPDRSAYPGWSWLGQVAFGPSWDNLCTGNTLLLQETVQGSGALGDFDHWERVWDDHGSGKTDDYSLWRGVAKDSTHYALLGDFFRVNGHSDEGIRGLKAVHRDHLLPGRVEDFVWSDRGTGANDDGSVWAIKPLDSYPGDGQGSVAYDGDKGIKPYFTATSGYDRPDTPVYVLDRSKVTLVDS